MEEIDKRIKGYLVRLDPKVLDLARVSEPIRIKKLGVGDSNLNYLVTINGSKFVVRINMYPYSLDKSERECMSLKIVGHLGIAPRAFHFEPSREYIGETFIVLEYQEGETLDTQGEIDCSTIRELANVVAQLHNSDLEDLADHLTVRGSSKTELLNEIEKRTSYIRAKRGLYFREDETFASLLEKPYEALVRSEFHQEPCYVLGHGDICPQNVIVSQGKLKLIDWEDMGLIDPALEVAGIFDAFDFSESQKEVFLEGYLAVREDTTLAERIPNFLPFQTFGVFCWAIVHVYEIGEREMHEAFLREQDLREHIAYAEKMFNKCKNAGIIEKDVIWDVSKIFPERYLAGL